MTSAHDYPLDPFFPAEVEDPSTDHRPAISLRSLRSALRRRRRFWVTAAVLGLLLGASLHSILPPKYTAVSRLALAEPSGGDPTQAMQSDVSLLETRTVAERAIADGHLDISPDKLLSSYSGLATSTSILTIKLSGASDATAIARNNAVANAFLDVRSEQLKSRNALTIKGLQSQVETLQAQIQQLTYQIAQLASSTKSGAAQQIADLVSQRTAAASQLSQVQSQIQQAQLDETSIVQGSQVLDSAAVTPPSTKKVMVKDGLSGLVAGLGLGVTIVIIGTLISDGVRRRAEVATALGAPVELSVGRIRRYRWFASARLRRRLKHPTAEMQMIHRRLRAHLDYAANGNLAVVEVVAAEPAALSTAMLAQSLANDGKKVLIVDAAEERPLARMLGIRKVVREFRSGDQDGVLQTVSLDGREAGLLIAPDDAARPVVSATASEHDVVLVLATVDPALGAEHISKWAEEAVVLVTAGRATAIQLDSVGRLLERSRVDVKSAVLIGADSDDQTIGLPVEPNPTGQTQSSVGALEAVEQ